MKEKLKQNKGITLIALVVTIIVIVLLAGATISIITNEEGLIKRSKEAKLMQDVATTKEELELLKAPVQIENYKVDLDGYLAELENVKEEYKASDIKRLDETTAEVVINQKYKFLLQDTELGDVEIIYQGETGGLKLGEIELDAVAYKGNYDGQEHDAVEVSVIPSDSKLEYALNNGEYTTVMPRVSGANEYTVSIKASKEGYTTKVITRTVIIGRQENTEGNLVLSATSGSFTETGTFTVTRNVSNGTLSVKSSNEDIATASISGTTVTITGKASGTTTITVTSSATTNYKAASATYTATVHVHTDDCYSTVCNGTFEKTGSTSQQYATCSHTHTTNGRLRSGTALTDSATYWPYEQYIEHSGDKSNKVYSISGCYATVGGNCGTNYLGNVQVKRLQSIQNQNMSYSCFGCHNYSMYIYTYSITSKCDTCNWKYINDFTNRNVYFCSDSCARNTNIIACGGKYYVRSCGKSAGTSNYTRTVETYKCSGCGATATYNAAANSGTCTRCGGSHNVAASGATSTTHNAVTKYLICGK